MIRCILQVVNASRQARTLSIGGSKLGSVRIERMLGEMIRARSCRAELMTAWMIVRSRDSHLLVHQITLIPFVAPGIITHHALAIDGHLPLSHEHVESRKARIEGRDWANNRKQSGVTTIDKDSCEFEKTKAPKVKRTS